MSLSVIPLTILGQITGVTGSGDTALYEVRFKSIDGTPLYGVTAVWTDEQAEIEALAAEKPYGVWINPIDGTFTVKFAGYTYVGSADLTDDDVLAGVTLIEFTSAEVSDRLLPEVTIEDRDKILYVSNDVKWKLTDGPICLLPKYVSPEYIGYELKIKAASLNATPVFGIPDPFIPLYLNDDVTLAINTKLTTMLPTIISSGSASDTIIYSSPDSVFEALNSFITDAAVNRDEDIENHVSRVHYVNLSIFSGLINTAELTGVLALQFNLSTKLSISGVMSELTLIVEKTNDTTITLYLYGKKLS